MIGAISAGNTAILKPSETAFHTQKVVKRLIDHCFSKEYIAAVTGGRDITSALIRLRVDYIFFTGSTKVGKIVMEAASKNLIPLTLELGGKSPTIVHKDANLEVAARRIAWGKFLNNGQTCVAPDYVLVEKSIEGLFIDKLKIEIENFYTLTPKESNDYGRIVDERQWDRLVQLINPKQVEYGGDFDKSELYIEPTILKDVTCDDAVMQEELFGPILPILTYDTIDEAINQILDLEKPLALYLFTESDRLQKRIVKEISFGGGCINDTVTHIFSPHQPFGGVGSSGLGSYHGKYSFECFSHRKSITKKTTKFDIKLLYPPYKIQLKFAKLIMK